jgi:hypothetical protein
VEILKSYSIILLETARKKITSRIFYQDGITDIQNTVQPERDSTLPATSSVNPETNLEIPASREENRCS